MNRRGFLGALLALPATRIVGQLLGNLGVRLPEQLKDLRVTLANASPRLDLQPLGISAARVRARIDELREPLSITFPNPRFIELAYDSGISGPGAEGWGFAQERVASASFKVLATRDFKEALDLERLYAARPFTAHFGPSALLGAPLSLVGYVQSVCFTDYFAWEETYILHVELANVSEVEWA